jgi:hypothetical protein
MHLIEQEGCGVDQSTAARYRLDSTGADLEMVPRHREEPGHPGRGARLLCRFCRTPVTDRNQAISIDGGHVHTRSNPAGITFCFGCFREAPGCAATGPATGRHSWFTGCRWQVAVCRACGEHLGWSFRGPAQFFGLILDRMTDGGP